MATRRALPLRCYHSRLAATARYAAEHGYDAFSSSLLYSRYQQHDLIRASGEALGQRFGVDFLYEDFRVGWQAGIIVSKAMGLIVSLLRLYLLRARSLSAHECLSDCF